MMVKAGIPTLQTSAQSETVFNNVSGLKPPLLEDDQGFAKRMSLALRGSLKQWRIQMLFSLVWACGITFCVIVYHINLHWRLDYALWLVARFYLLGAFIGGYLTILIATAVAANKPQTARFALFLCLLVMFTLGFTMLLFLLQHRLYFSQWHADALSVTWFYQVFFTGLGSIFLFLLTGLRPILPWGAALLVIASYCFSRGWLSSSR